MRNLVLTLAAMLCVQLSFSQVKNIEYSAPFEEPLKGWYKVMQLKNGNTFYFTFNNEGVTVTVYKPDRKLAARKVLAGKIWDAKDMKNSIMEGIYEIDGKPVIFLQQEEKKRPVLFRIQLNPENGSISDEAEIGRMEKGYSGMANYMLQDYAKVPPQDFVVEKDPYSESYAVMAYDTHADDKENRVVVSHYTVEGGKHTLVNKKPYHFDSKFILYIGMCVNGSESVNIAFYEYNRANAFGYESDKYKDSRVLLSKLGENDNEFTNAVLPFDEEMQRTHGLMVYNPFTQMIQLLTITLLESKGGVAYYMGLVSYIDPNTLQLLKKVTIPADMLNNNLKSKFNVKNDFRGLPINMLLNNDNSTTLLAEETSEFAINSSSTSIDFRNLGVITMDATGTDVDAFGMIKHQVATGHPMDFFYYAKKGKGLWSYVTRRGMTMYTPDDNRSFYSFDYVNTAANNKYIIFNDSRDNYKGTERVTNIKELKPIKYVTESIAMIHKMTYNKIESNYLYGKPANDNSGTICNVESSHFVKETGVYAALMIKRNGKEKKAYISWVTLE